MQIKKFFNNYFSKYFYFIGYQRNKNTTILIFAKVKYFKNKTSEITPQYNYKIQNLQLLPLKFQLSFVACYNIHLKIIFAKFGLYV